MTNCTQRLLTPLLLAALWLLPWAPATHASEVYKHVDEDGNVSFSDQPRDGGKWVPLDQTNTVAPPPAWKAQQHNRRKRPDNSAGYWQVDIVSPGNDSIIPNGLSPTEVVARINPAVEPHQRVRLLLDGVPVAESSRAGFTIDRIARGSHTLQVELRDGDSLLGSSEPVTIFVYWPGG